MITLTTDFGLKDPYVAEMKGVILTVAPKAAIIDVTHEIEKFNIRQGAFTLACAAPYFPEGTIHVAVVDPGVGSKRLPILIQTKRGFFIGPDNGVLALAAENQGIEHIYKLSTSKFMLPEVSSTFHGRDIFAPAAAHLEKGVKPSEFGPEIKSLTKPEFANVKIENKGVVGEVLHIDSFGNIITNISQKTMSQLGAAKALNVVVANRQWTLDYFKTYTQAEQGKLMSLIGSHGYLEIAIHQGNAAEAVKVKVGDKIKISPS